MSTDKFSTSSKQPRHEGLNPSSSDSIGDDAAAEMFVLDFEDDDDLGSIQLAAGSPSQPSSGLEPIQKRSTVEMPADFEMDILSSFNPKSHDSDPSLVIGEDEFSIDVDLDVDFDDDSDDDLYLSEDHDPRHTIIADEGNYIDDDEILDLFLEDDEDLSYDDSIDDAHDNTVGMDIEGLVLDPSRAEFAQDFSEDADNDELQSLFEESLEGFADSSPNIEISDPSMGIYEDDEDVLIELIEEDDDLILEILDDDPNNQASEPPPPPLEFFSEAEQSNSSELAQSPQNAQSSRQSLARIALTPLLNSIPNTRSQTALPAIPSPGPHGELTAEPSQTSSSSTLPPIGPPLSISSSPVPQTNTPNSGPMASSSLLRPMGLPSKATTPTAKDVQPPLGLPPRSPSDIVRAKTVGGGLKPLPDPTFSATPSEPQNPPMGPPPRTASSANLSPLGPPRSISSASLAPMGPPPRTNSSSSLSPHQHQRSGSSTSFVAKPKPSQTGLSSPMDIGSPKSSSGRPPSSMAAPVRRPAPSSTGIPTLGHSSQVKPQHDNGLIEQLQGVQSKLEQRTREVSTLKQTSRTSAEKLYKTHNALQNSEQTRIALEGEASSLKSEVNRLKALLEEHQEREIDLQEALGVYSEKSKSLDNLQSRFESMKSETNTLRSEKIDSETKLQSLKIERNEDQKILDEALETMSSLAEANKRYEKKVEELESITVQEQNQRAEIQQQTTEMHAELERLRTLISTQQAALEEALKNTEGLQAENESTFAALNVATGNEAALKHQLEESVTLAEQLHEQLSEKETLHRDYEAYIKQLEQSRDSQSTLMEQSTALQQEHKELARAYEELQHAHFERSNRLMAALADAEKFRADAEKFKADTDKALQNLGATREATEAFQDEILQVEKERDALRQDKVHATELIDGLQNELNAQQNDKDRLQKKCSVLQEQLAEATSLGKQNERALHQAQNDVKKQGHKEAKLLKTIQKLKSDLAKARQQSALAADQSRLQAENEALRAKLAKANENFEARGEQLEKTRQRLDRTLDKLDELERLNAEIHQLRESIDANTRASYDALPAVSHEPSGPPPMSQIRRPGRISHARLQSIPIPSEPPLPSRTPESLRSHRSQTVHEYDGPATRRTFEDHEPEFESDSMELEGDFGLPPEPNSSLFEDDLPGAMDDYEDENGYVEAGSYDSYDDEYADEEFDNNALKSFEDVSFDDAELGNNYANDDFDDDFDDDDFADNNFDNDALERDNFADNNFDNDALERDSFGDASYDEAEFGVGDFEGSYGEDDFGVEFEDDSAEDYPSGFGVEFPDSSEPGFDAVEFANEPLSEDMNLEHFRTAQSESNDLENDASYIFELTDPYDDANMSPDSDDSVSRLLTDSGFDEPLELMADVPADVGAEIDALFDDDRSPGLTEVDEETALSPPNAAYLSLKEADDYPSGRGAINLSADLPDRDRSPMEYLRSRDWLDKCPSVDYSQAHNIDHRAGFLLGQADGGVTIEDMIDLSGMSSREAAQLVLDLLDQGALRF